MAAEKHGTLAMATKERGEFATATKGYGFGLFSYFGNSVQATLYIIVMLLAVTSRIEITSAGPAIPKCTECDSPDLKPCLKPGDNASSCFKSLGRSCTKWLVKDVDVIHSFYSGCKANCSEVPCLVNVKKCVHCCPEQDDACCQFYDFNKFLITSPLQVLFTINPTIITWTDSYSNLSSPKSAQLVKTLLTTLDNGLASGKRVYLHELAVARFEKAARSSVKVVLDLTVKYLRNVKRSNVEYLLTQRIKNPLAHHFVQGKITYVDRNDTKNLANSNNTSGSTRPSPTSHALLLVCPAAFVAAALASCLVGPRW